MPENYQAPGVYPLITDLSQVITNAATSIIGIVGEAERGPVFKPTLVGSFSGYTKKFGQPNLKYGYMGHTLAVAFDSANQAQVVRVVGSGYKYAAIKIPSETTGGSYVPVPEGYSKTIVESDHPEAAMFTGDNDNIMAVVASNPNEVQFQISLEETTYIPGNYKATSVSGNKSNKEVTVTAEGHGLSVGDYVLITKSSDNAYNGKFAVTDVTTNTFKYTATENLESTTPLNLRFVKYPDNSERTFSLSEYEVIEGVSVLKNTYTGLTIYDGKDGQGKATNIATVINKQSDLVRVYLNAAVIGSEEDGWEFPVMNAKPQTLTGGSNGGAVTSADISAAWDLLSNKDLISVNLLLNCGYVSEEDSIVASKMKAIADKRRDCFFLADVPYNMTTPEKSVDFRKNGLRLDTFRGAVTSQWIKTTDSFSGAENVLLPGSAFQAAVICHSDSISPYKAPAGPRRGIISSGYCPVTGLSTDYEKEEQGYVYSNGLNYFKRNPAGAYLLFGQKTLQTNNSALNRIKAARTVIILETALITAAENHLFEDNTAFLRAQITEQFSDYLDTVVTGGGLTRYAVVCDETNNTPQIIDSEQLNIDIYLYPTHTAEFIRLQSVIMGTDADISVFVSTGGYF